MCDPITAVLGIGSMVLGSSQKAPPPPPPVKAPASAQDNVQSASGADVRFGDDRKKTNLEKETGKGKKGPLEGRNKRLGRMSILGGAITQKELKARRKASSAAAERDKIISAVLGNGQSRPSTNPKTKKPAILDLKKKKVNKGVSIL